MGKLGVHPVLGAIVLASVSVSWAPFRSTVYSYTISQPSSFKHIVLPNTANQQVDYFFPSVGSFPTNVNIVGVPGHAVGNWVSYFHGINGHNIHRSGWVNVMGQRRPLMHADFSTLVGKFSVDEVRFVDRDTVWQLTASYEPRFRSMRTLMLRMLASFQSES